ncbi:thiamine phosphate synthase [Pararhodospirillum photometricum]|uniref:Thiamine monophosphate synthase n=1 Tax=Pararhodospirillum photometricum DSM 122 TaxID=1150469 RepID=H6SN36_PARPM|nr:thiamine phosphate synthase [Pararhodospirillum photometricum]CCG06912.1 Thiamine monophosphate synthase [Pararhodospirillum photometricum DSM 122]
MTASLSCRAERVHRRAGRPKAPAAVLVTDERRLPDPRPVLPALPRGARVVLRAYGDPTRAGAVVAAARRRRIGVILALAAPRLPPLPRDLAGIHLPQGRACRGLMAGVLLWRRAAAGRSLSMAAHDGRALARARALRLTFVLLSPVFPTRSHPGAPALGPLRATLLARTSQVPVLALGGITPTTAARLPPRPWSGLAALESWTKNRGVRGGPASPPSLPLPFPLPLPPEENMEKLDSPG